MITLTLFTVADLHNKILDACTPRGPNSFNFIQFLENLVKPYVGTPGGLATPPRGNHGSATGLWQWVWMRFPMYLHWNRTLQSHRMGIKPNRVRHRTPAHRMHMEIAPYRTPSLTSTATHFLHLSRSYSAFLPPANEVWGKVIFSAACVKNSVHSGEGVPGQVHPPWTGTPPQSGTPPGSSACWEIRATSRQYASYWNAFLFLFAFAMRCVDVNDTVHTVRFALLAM